MKIVTSQVTSSLTMVGGHTLHLNASEAEHVQVTKIENLRKIKKLALVLDLDHTLVHAVQVEGSAPASSQINDVERQKGIYHLPIEELVQGTIMHLRMKKRPHLDKFLSEANKICQLSVYTAGISNICITCIIYPNILSLSRHSKICRGSGEDFRPRKHLLQQPHRESIGRQICECNAEVVAEAISQ
jgi:hypothetical protein